MEPARGGGKLDFNFDHRAARPAKRSPHLPEHLKHCLVLGQNQGAEPLDPMLNCGIRQRVEEGGTEASALVFVCNGNGRLRYFRLVVQSHVAGDADSRVTFLIQGERAPGEVVVVIDLRQIVEHLGGQLRNGSQKTEVTRARRQSFKALLQTVPVVGCYWSDPDAGPVSEFDVSGVASDEIRIGLGHGRILRRQSSSHSPKKTEVLRGKVGFWGAGGGYPEVVTAETSTWLRPLYRVYEERLIRQLDRDRLPRHVGIILDGHRRYAMKEGLPDYAASYRAGMRKFEDFVGWSAELGIPAVTGWVLSKENLSRPASELELYYEALIDLFSRLPQLAKRHGLTVRFIGSLDLLPAEVVRAAKRAEEVAASGLRRLTIALGYAGRQEIVDACRDLVQKLVSEGVSQAEMVDRIDADTLAAHMYTADLPDPDLLIRTSGESRLSGFLLWQSAYAEFAFVDVYWPAFRRVDFLRELRDFGRRERRFGQ